MNRSIDVSMVVYGHEVDEIHSVIISLCNSCELSLITRLNIDILDNKGDFSFDSLLDKFKFNQYSYEIDINCIIRRDNPGYSVSNNITIFNGSGNYHLILNPDVIFDEMAIKNGIQYLEKNANCVLVSPKIMDENGAVISGIKRYPNLFVLVLRFLNFRTLNRIFCVSLNSYSYECIIERDKESSVEICSGCCMLCRKEDLVSVGGFDERFFLYFEDFDLSLRLGKIGNLDYCPQFIIKHFGGNTGRKGAKHIFFFVNSMMKFFKKHGFKFW